MLSAVGTLGLTRVWTSEHVSADKTLHMHEDQYTKEACAALTDTSAGSSSGGSDQHDDCTYLDLDTFEGNGSFQLLTHCHSNTSSSFTGDDTHEQGLGQQVVDTAGASTDSNGLADTGLQPAIAETTAAMKPDDQVQRDVDQLHTAQPDMNSSAMPNSTQHALTGNADWHIPAARRSASFRGVSSSRGTGSSRGMGSIRGIRSIRGVGSIRGHASTKGRGSMFTAMGHGNDYLAHHDENSEPEAHPIEQPDTGSWRMHVSESVNNGTAAATCSSSAADASVLTDSLGDALVGSKITHAKGVNHSRYPSGFSSSVSRPAGGSTALHLRKCLAMQRLSNPANTHQLLPPQFLADLL